MSFDPDAYLAEKKAAPSFDPDAYLAEKKAPEPKHFVDMSPMEMLASAARGLDSVTGAPTRAAIGAAQDGKNPFTAAYDQFNEDPDKAPTGKQIVQKAGVSDTTKISPTGKEKKNMSFAERLAHEAFDPLNLLTGGLATVLPESVKDKIRENTPLGDWSTADAAGLAMDVAADPTTLIPVGALSKGAKAAAGAAKASVAGKIGRGAETVAKAAALKSTGGTLKDLRHLLGRGKADELARYMLDNGLEAFDDVEDIAKKFGDRAESAGKVLDDVYAKAGEKFKDVIDKVGFDPLRDKGELLSAARKELGNTVGAEDAVKTLEKYLDEVAARHGNKPAEAALAAYKKEISEYLPKLRNYMKERAAYRQAIGSAADDAAQPALPGLVDDGQRTTSKSMQVELQGKPAADARLAEASPQQQMYLPDLPTGQSEAERIFRSVDNPFGKNMGSRVEDALVPSAQKEFLEQNSKEQISLFGKQAEAEGLDLVPRSYKEVQVPGVSSRGGQASMAVDPGAAPARPARPGDIRNPMNPRAANEIKSALDQQIKYSRNPLMPDPAKERAFHAARTKISQKVDEAIEAFGGDELLEQLKAANKEYGSAKTVADIAKDRVARDSANQLFSLTDKIAGTGAGSAMLTVAGGPKAIAVGAVTAAGSKLVRKYGATTVAVAADRVSKFLLKDPVIVQIAKTKPQEYQAVVINLTRRALERSGEVAKAAENEKVDPSTPAELDSDSSVPANEKVETPAKKKGDRAPADQPESRKEAPTKGPEKWAADGIENVARHAPGLQIDRASVMADPRKRELLIFASELKPGSKAMDQLVAQLNLKERR